MTAIPPPLGMDLKGPPPRYLRQDALTRRSKLLLFGADLAREVHASRVGPQSLAAETNAFQVVNA